MNMNVTRVGRIRRGAFVAAALAAAALVLMAGLAPPSALAAETTEPASAPPISGSLSMTSDPGDYIGQGLSYAYDTAGGDVFGSDSNGNAVHIAVTGAQGDWWYLDFAAPGGAQLAPGSYPNATRYPFQAPTEPGLSVYGQGRGCNQLTGSFEVLEASYGADGSLASFQATFEQHCEGEKPALRGSVQFGPPPLLEMKMSVNPTGSLDHFKGTAIVRGTISCSRPAQAQVQVTLSQQRHDKSVSDGTSSLAVDCSPTVTSWQAPVVATDGLMFAVGMAKADVSASAFDTENGVVVQVESRSEVGFLYF